MLVLSRRARAAIALGAACTIASVAPSRAAYAQKDKDKDKGKSGSTQCQIDQNEPSELVSANLYLTKAQASKDTAEQTKDYQAVVGLLTGKGAKINNPPGRDFVLARTYIGFLDRPGSPSVAPRSTFGFKDDPTTPYDLISGLDTLVSALQAAKPECAPQAANLREHVYVPLVNQGIQLLNAKQLDSAQAVASRAAQVYPQGPYSYYIMASVALQKKDLQTSAQQYQKTLDVAGSDTAYAKLKLEVTYNQGVVYQQMATAATGPEKAEDAKKAAADFKIAMDANPNDNNAKAGYAAALAASGDTAALASTYGDKLVNPSKYTPLQLFQAGITAAQMNHIKDADSLFTLGLAKNPYFPDAVLYVANNAFNDHQIEKLSPLARRLVELTPNNSDAYRLMAGEFQLRSKTDKTAAEKKTDADSTLKYYQKYKELPIEVTITQFAVDSNSTTMAGKVDNRGTTPKPVTLTFQLLDANGGVVATQTVPALTVAPGGSQPFSFKAAGTGVAGYKYAPVN
jgi:tetratricopeptide (TPR) repeat protein